MTKTQCFSFGLIAASLVIGCIVTVHVYKAHHEKIFEAQEDKACDDIAAMMDKLDDNDQMFDLADERAEASTRKLLDIAYTKDLRDGSALLSGEVDFLRACRRDAAKAGLDAKAQGADYWQASLAIINSKDQCLRDFGKIDQMAFSKLPKSK